MRVSTSILFALLFALPSLADQIVLERDAGTTVTCTVDATSVAVTGILNPSCSEPFCGDGACDPGETACTCTDCGTPPATEDLCGDGADNDCDGLADCADPDCSAACEPPPAGDSPPLTSLEGWWSWDQAHAVTCDVMPVNTLCMGCAPPAGSCIHHLVDKSPGFPVRELTEIDPRWWPTAGSDGLVFSDDDQLVFRTCTSLDPLVCTDVPWELAEGEPWSFVFVGYIQGPGYILGYPTGTTGAAYVSVANSGAWLVRIQSRAKQVVGGVANNTRVAVLLERRADGSYVMTTREPCSTTLVDRSSGALATGGVPAFGCLSCYYQNETNPADPLHAGIPFFREAMIYRRDFSNLTDRGDLLSYLEAEHGAWIDEGCAP